MEGDSVPVFSPGFIREARIRAPHNLETSVEFLSRPRQRGHSLECFWWITSSYYNRRKRAPFSGVDTEVDTERYPRLASQYNVRGIPNFAVFSRGQLQFQQAGLVDASHH